MPDTPEQQANQGSPTSRQDPVTNRLSDLESKTNQQISKKHVVEYTFTGTGEESFLHGLGMMPNAVMVADNDTAAHITINRDRTNTRRAYVQSSVAGAKVRFLVF